MAGEFKVAYSTGATLRAILYSPAGTVWQTTTSTFVTYVNANRANYLITLAETDSNGIYLGTFPAGQSAGLYSVEYLVSPYAVANRIAASSLPWNGSALDYQSGDNYAVVTDAAFGLSKLVRSTTPANTLDVSSTGEAGLDFNNVKQATGATTLTNIRIPNVTLTDTVTTYTGNTPQTGDSFARIGSTGSGLTSLAPSATALSNAVWTNAKAAFLDAAITSRSTLVATDIVSSGAITTSSGAVTLTTGNINSIADQVWDEVLSGHLTAGSTGFALNAAGSAGDPWGTSLPGAYGAGTAGNIVGNNLNAAITSRMATYTQPTGFLAATFPATIASPTSVLAAGDIDGYSLEDTLKLCLAALAGKLSGAATTIVTIRAADDSKNRITATVDVNGNRSAVTLDATG